MLKMPCDWSVALSIAREYFTDIPLNEDGDNFLGFIIWNETGWPAFFMEGEKSFREQLEIASRQPIDDDDMKMAEDLYRLAKDVYEQTTPNQD